MTKGCQFKTFKSTDSKAPIGQPTSSRLIYAERLRRELLTFWPNFDWLYQHETRNHGTHETKPPPHGTTDAKCEPTTRANETTTKAEPLKPKATQKTKPQPTPSPRPLQEAHASIDWGPRVQVLFVSLLELVTYTTGGIA